MALTFYKARQNFHEIGFIRSTVVWVEFVATNKSVSNFSIVFINLITCADPLN